MDCGTERTVIANTATLEQIRAAGLNALQRELGVVGMVRFLQQFEPGDGDYVEERKTFVGKLGVRALGKRIQAVQRQRRRPRG
jgi:hypothetical protein